MFSKQLCCMSTWLKFADSQWVYYRWYFSYVSQLFATFSRSLILVLHVNNHYIVNSMRFNYFYWGIPKLFLPSILLFDNWFVQVLLTLHPVLLFKQCFYIGFQRIFFFCDFFIFLRAAPLIRASYARLSPRVFSPFRFCIFYQMFLSCTSCLK